LGISRLAVILENDWGTPRFRTHLRGYAKQTTDELLATSRLISSMYCNMKSFPVFTTLSLLYFAAASFSETARRLNKPHMAPSFLLHDHPTFGPACSELLQRSHHLNTEEESARLIDDILDAIEPIDVAGLCNRERHNWYPVNADDLIQSAHKVQSTPSEISKLLQNCGFYQ
jgi:FADH2 O2-dependent halogenase